MSGVASGGGADGSRWSERSERPPESWRGAHATPAGVAEQISSGVNFLRDRCRGRNNARTWIRWSLASLGPPATVRVPIRGRDSRYVKGSAIIRDPLGDPSGDVDRATKKPPAGR